jgi:hypothetical protein
MSTLSSGKISAVWYSGTLISKNKRLFSIRHSITTVCKDNPSGVYSFKCCILGVWSLVGTNQTQHYKIGIYGKKN